ncbi:Atlastin-2 [Halotydeus destructor]|nr:Atlastin-2 [Halotydeus destructor]
MELFNKLVLVALAIATIVNNVSTQSGTGVQVVKLNERTKGFELNETALESVLMRPECADKPVSIVSIAGATRKGKSFMLNFFIKFLNVKGWTDPTGWLGDPDTPLQGFSWRGGVDRDTSGILLWSVPFVMRNPDGEDVCLLLMDTQGAFDGKHTIADTAAIFAISTMTSSVQIYNLVSDIQEDDLQHLELFVEYGRLANEETELSPFQKLIFLVRDFQFGDEFVMGLKGGKRFLDHKLEYQFLKDRLDQVARVRKNIRTAFSELECYTMPHPGKVVATTKDFDGRLSLMDPEFVDHLGKFVPHVLSPENILVKSINGRNLTGRELVEYFKAYVSAFAGGTLPEPQTIMEATAYAGHQAAVADAKEFYLMKMDQRFTGDYTPVLPSEFDSIEAGISAQAIDQFNSFKKLGRKEFTDQFRQRLLKTLSDSAIKYRNSNMFMMQIEEQRQATEAMKKKYSELEEANKLQKEIRDRELKQQTALGKALDHYVTRMSEGTNGAQYMNPADLDQLHLRISAEAESVFRQHSDDLAGLEIARREIEKNYANEKQKNDLKLKATELEALKNKSEAEIKKVVEDRDRKAAEAKAEMDRLNAEYQNFKNIRDKEVSEQTAIGRARANYMARLEKVFNTISRKLEESYLHVLHVRASQEAVNVYNKNGGDTTGPAMDKLREELGKIYENFQQRNENKGIAHQLKLQTAQQQKEIEELMKKQEIMARELEEMKSFEV